MVRGNLAVKSLNIAPAAAVIAWPVPGSLVLVEQWRYAVGRRIWEIPAGLVEPGEAPIDAARRELREETGYHTETLRVVSSAYSAPGFCTELLHFFAADEIVLGEREPDEGEEDMIVRVFTIAELNEAVAKGDILDLKTLYAIEWIKQHF